MKNKLNKTLKIIILTVASLVGIYIILLLGSTFIIFALNDFDPHSIKIDTCLDNGCKWNYKTNECECSENIETKENQNLKKP